MSAYTLPSSIVKGNKKPTYSSRADSMWRPMPRLSLDPELDPNTGMIDTFDILDAPCTTDTPDTYCTVCKGPLLSLPKDPYGKIEPYAKTSCSHNLCFKCIDPFMDRQLSRHADNIKIPRHKCQLCGRKYLQVFRPYEAGDSSVYPSFESPSQLTIFGKRGNFSYKGTDGSELSESMKAAAQRMKELHIEAIDIIAVMVVKMRGTAETKLPYSMKRFHDIADIMDSIVL